MISDSKRAMHINCDINDNPEHSNQLPDPTYNHQSTLMTHYNIGDFYGFFLNISPPEAIVTCQELPATRHQGMQFQTTPIASINPLIFGGLKSRHLHQHKRSQSNR
jgi:hypothetical protein